MNLKASRSLDQKLNSSLNLEKLNILRFSGAIAVFLDVIWKSIVNLVPHLCQIARQKLG